MKCSSTKYTPDVHGSSLSRFLCKLIYVSCGLGMGSGVVSGVGLAGVVLVLQAVAGEAEHVDQPAGATAVATREQESVELVAGCRAGLAEELFADLQYFGEQLVVVLDAVVGHGGCPHRWAASRSG